MTHRDSQPPFNRRRLVQTAEPAKQLVRLRSSASSDAWMARQAFAQSVCFKSCSKSHDSRVQSGYPLVTRGCVFFFFFPQSAVQAPSETHTHNHTFAHSFPAEHVAANLHPVTPAMQRICLDNLRSPTCTRAPASSVDLARSQGTTQRFKSHARAHKDTPTHASALHHI